MNVIRTEQEHIMIGISNPAIPQLFPIAVIVHSIDEAVTYAMGRIKAWGVSSVILSVRGVEVKIDASDNEADVTKAINDAIERRGARA